MRIKKKIGIVMILLVSLSIVACKKSGPSGKLKLEDLIEANTEKTSLEGDWFAQIDIPDNQLIIILEFNLAGNSECEISCAWIDSVSGEIKESSGKATYRVIDGDKLEIKFLNRDELIRKDNVFDMTNVYNIILKGDKMIILDSPQFRNIDIEFGVGFENRGYSTITF